MSDELARVQLRRLVAREWDQLKARAAATGRNPLLAFGQKMFSQGDEDGIIREICRRLGLTHGRFVEIGCGDGTENNTLALLASGWNGHWVESSSESCERIREIHRNHLSAGTIQLHELHVHPKRVSSLRATVGMTPVDLLSIDIDGQDARVWEALAELRPAVVVIEYNARFVPGIRWVMAPHDSAWQGTDYYGASLDFLVDLGTRLGYRLVACNVTGVNAFFVRDDLAGPFASSGRAGDFYEPARHTMIPFLDDGHPVDLRTLASLGARS